MQTLARTRTTDPSERRSQPPSQGSTGVRMGYLLSRYPAISHTFFLHEVLGLRARGIEIETASINLPDRPVAALPEVEASESGRTFYLKGGSKIKAAGELLGTLLTAPGVVLRGLAVVFAIEGLNLRKRLYWLLYLAEAILVGRWMREHRLGHLHVHFGGPVASVGMLTAAAWRVPFSMTIHGPEELLNIDANQLREKVKAAEFVFCISDFCRSQLCQLTPPAEWEKFQVIRLGVDPMLLTPGSRENANNVVETRRLELVCTGRLVPEKGHRVLLGALVRLRAKGLELHTTLIGSGPELAGLEQFVARHGMERLVNFTSALSHPQTLAHLRRADVFVLASFAEGIPVALMEAMSLGVPCVSTTIAGIPELIRSGVDGLLVSPANEEALAAALESLVVDPALRRSLGGSGRQRILSLYNLPLNHEMLALAFAARLERETGGRGSRHSS